MMWLYLKNETDLFSSEQKKMLHIAPEQCFVEKLRNHPHIDYLSTDLTNHAMVTMDITDIHYSNNTFDAILCSHVFEHVQNDKKAMSELVRVLLPTGWAILQVPLGTGKTFENPNITEPSERERLFGQKDHIRLYGPDYKERLEDQEFSVTVVPYLDQFQAADRKRYGMSLEKDDIYFCTLK